MPETTIERMVREARARLKHSIGTRAGIAMAQLRRQAQAMRERAAAPAPKEVG